MLRLLFKSPQRERYVRELAQMGGFTLCTVQDELRKLSALKLVKSRSDGFHKFYRANREHTMFHSLVDIVGKSERAPEVKHSIAHRLRRKPRPPRHRPLPPDRPINWHLSSGPSKT